MRPRQCEVLFSACVCVYVCVCLSAGKERKKKKQPFTVSQSLSRARVCLAACVCISDFPCVFVSACISGWVGVQLSSRRTFGSRSPLPTSNCPSRPAELPNDFTYTSLICLGRVAATIWHFSLYMSFAASYRVKFNCTSPTVASVVGSPRFLFFFHPLRLTLSGSQAYSTTNNKPDKTERLELLLGRVYEFDLMINLWFSANTPYGIWCVN